MKFIGPSIAVAVRRDQQELCWRARCFKVPFVIEASDNRELVALIASRLHEALKDKKLRQSLEIELVDEGDEVHVPFHCTKV